jgi:D-alanine-D-alanine ligase-like ATP-grasp enzyme
MSVRGATDKRIAFFNWDLKGVQCVPWTTDKAVAQGWNKKQKVIGRTACQQAGSGIKVYEPDSTLKDHQLYTLYIPKKREFRVHVFRGKAILVSEKRKKKGVDSDYIIRANHKGWVFCYKDVNEPDGLRVLGVNAVRACGLDFGAVDIIYNEHYNKMYVLEINSAPGIEGSTLEAYTNAICEGL